MKVTDIAYVAGLTLLATVEDCSNVAAQVHCDTMVVAVNPALTLPPASNWVSKLFYTNMKIQTSMYIQSH